MSKLIIPDGYKSVLNLYETQSAIGILKRNLEKQLQNELNLKRVSAPLFVEPSTGLNDDLNGIERPVEFSIKDCDKTAQVVHSLAKWKRMALYKYGFPVDEGIYTDMNAIRRDEEMDNVHSIYVDQWDWEKVISKEERTEEYFKNTVRTIVKIICFEQEFIKDIFPKLTGKLNQEVFFITTQQLEDMFPEMTPKQRENEITRKYGTVCIMQIGDKLASGKPHDGRAPDYDDWKLNGDILFWDEILQCALEISSMGIRVDKFALEQQLKKAGCEERKNMEFHKMLLEEKLPLTIGGGIGQSRICMLLLQKAHVGEVQVSIWDDDTINGCKKAGISLL